MGIISNIFGHKNDPEKENAQNIYDKFSSYGITSLSEDQIYRILKGAKEEYRKRNIAWFGDDFELIARPFISAGNRLPSPMEDYAQEICDLFSKNGDFNSIEPQLRDIGMRIDDNYKQLLVAFRAEYLCEQAHQNGNNNTGEFTTRYLEIAWDGIGGWRS